MGIPPRYMMKCVAVISLVLVVVSAQQADWSGNCYFSGSLCNPDTGCSYGCWKNLCWSQCNGICTIKDIIDEMGNGDIHDGHDVIDALTPDSTTCAKCGEWCYLDDGDKNYQPCASNHDCEAIKMNKCRSHCAVI